MVVGSNTIAATWASDIAPVSSKEFLNIQATTECRFTLKQIRDMIKHTVKCNVQISTHSTAQSLASLGIWLSVLLHFYKLSDCGFESCYPQFNLVCSHYHIQKWVKKYNVLWYWNWKTKNSLSQKPSSDNNTIIVYNKVFLVKKKIKYLHYYV